MTDGPTGGIVFQISEDNLFFIGVFQDLISQAISQNFTEILDYKHPSPGNVLKIIKCVFNRREFEQLRLPQAILDDVKEKGSIFEFYSIRSNSLLLKWISIWNTPLESVIAFWMGLLNCFGRIE